ncbi:unnamed protein product [Paramecium pentaurelia]|uniref:Uncharacterized protein n=1 Tax=Paramecium pentaurelia TaxID=43138 RepID=A0A8S1VV21_9CILI|nr:unnamed protein product [Paramecium pentaurelia]
MLLHYAIHIVEKNQSINDSSTMTNLDFRLIKPNTGEKYYYPVFGKNCNHFVEKFIDLQDVVNGFNSQNNSYKCPHCAKVYEEVSDFVTHDFYIRIKNDFHPLIDKISVLHGILLSHIKRNKRRFGDPLTSNQIQQKIKFLLTENNEDQFEKAQQFSYLAFFDQKLKSNNQFQFWSICLLDNVNIKIPVRHKNCKHIENYRDLQNKQLQERESNQYLKCIKIGCSSLFPLISDQKLLDCLVVDFELLKTIKRSYPGNQLFVVSKLNNDEITLSDYISKSVSNKDQFISIYCNNNKLDKLFQLSFSEFQRIVLEKMATVINLELHRNVQEKINQYKHSNCQKKLKYQSGQMVELLARCVNCPIPKENESQNSETKISLLNWDIRTFVAFIVHKQNKKKIRKKLLKNYNALYVKLNLEGIWFKFNLTMNQFFMILSYIRKCRLTQKKLEISLFSYKGKEYLLENFKNLWKYTREDFQVIKEIVKFKRYIMNQFIIQILKIY